MHRTQLLREMTLSYVISPPDSESINTSSRNAKASYMAFPFTNIPKQLHRYNPIK
jgi:hypothetical protein